LLEPSFGGINLEDIAAPDCFVIEQTLRERMNIPVFHDDQHGTAIITAAGLINACLLTKRDLAKIKVVVNGAGAAAIACTELIKAMGVRGDNVIMCDRKGVIHKGREDVDQWKSAHAVDTQARTLHEALVGADVFLGLSAAGALKARNGRRDGRPADHLRNGQPGSRKSGRRTRSRRVPTRSSPPAAPTFPTR
jgi:malate dehydrogenase (oxaloacetate-decarboxylating)(NADP+)